jgi:hypothetical protein
MKYQYEIFSVQQLSTSNIRYHQMSLTYTEYPNVKPTKIECRNSIE